MREQLYNQVNSDKRVSRNFILELVAKFRKTGSVTNRQRIAVEVAALGHVTVDHQLSTRQLAVATVSIMPYEN